MNDTELLKSFAEQNSEAAFRLLVEHHLPLVLGTARRITGEPALAEEIAQAVFILLAKKASSFGTGTIVSGWLYRTTGFVAKRALLAEQRRRRREERAVAMQIHDDPNPLWQKVAPQLDEAMGRLGETDRHALLLHFFENRSLREVGEALGLKEEAAKKRVSRAVEKLKRILSRRGSEISAAALIAGLAHESSAASATAGLVSKIVATGAASITAGTTGAMATSALVNEVLRAWRWATVKAAAMACLGVVALLLLPALLREHRDGLPVSAPEAIQAVDGPIPPTVAQNAKPAGGSEWIEYKGEMIPAHPLLIKVLDGATDEPIPKAEVTHTLQYELSGDQPLTPELTDSNGVVALTIPSRWPGYERQDQFSVWVKANDYASRTINWLSTTGCALSIVSTQYTVRLDAGVTLAGTVLDEKGRPVPDVKIGALGNGYRGYTTTMDVQGRVTSPPEFREEDFPDFLINCDDAKAPTTDGNGRFLLEHFPSDLQALAIDLVGPDGARSRFRTPQGKHLTADELPEVELAELRAGTARLVLPRGVILEGAVVNGAGEPIAGATVTLRGTQWGAMKEFSRVDADIEGRFWITNPPPREGFLVGSAIGYASASTIVDPRRGSGPITFRLSPEEPLRCRVVNEANQPVAQASVRTPDYLMRRAGFGFSWSATTDADGRWTWQEAPTNPVPLFIASPDYAPRLVYLKPATNEQTIVLRPKESAQFVHVIGKVTDAETGSPIEFFTVKISHTTSGNLPDREKRSVQCKEGQLDVRIAASEIRVGASLAWILQIEAEGYEPAVTRLYDFAEGDQALELKLQRGGTVAGIVLTPTGEPAANAQLALPQEGDGALSSKAGELSKRYLAGTTDSSGTFSLKKVLRGRGLLTFHDSGWAFTPLERGFQQLNVQLLPWSRIEGTVRNAETPLAGQQVALSKLTWNWSDGLTILHSATTDSEGHFAFDKLPPGEYQVSLYPRGTWQRFVTTYPKAMQTPVSVGIGETQKVTLAECGKSALAQLRRPANLTSLSWDGALATLSRVVAVPPAPAQGDYVNNDSLAEARLRWSLDPDVKAALRQERLHIGTVGTDGIARFENIPAGRYILEVKLLAPKEAAPRSGHEQSNVAGYLRAAVAVPGDGDPSQEGTAVQLGEFTLVAR